MRTYAPVETPIGKCNESINRLVAFIIEREAVRLRKEAGAPAPWTEDRILREWRFCCVHREDDRVTRWLRREWYEKHADDPDLWFAAVVARFVNWPETLVEVGWPVPWDAGRFVEKMHSRRARGEKLYSAAYMVTTQGSREFTTKQEYQALVVFNPLWKTCECMRPKPEDTLNSYHVLLGQFHGLGSFMAAQVIADLKYCAPLRNARDWWTFAASGPGSRRGLNRVLGRPVRSPWTEDEWRLRCEEVRRSVNLRLKAHYSAGNADHLHGQDVQNCFCEFDKYERVRLDEGKPRSRYVTHGGLL